ncbi:MAG TPA: PQQ-dependent sugar dehydrogenase, partial [Thermoanaerobaculia bacterium]|nr:PQQ-dependent sugar dehydrogenase [Thermoanaerobaculia bacterium]
MKYGSPSRWLVVPLCLFLSAQLSAQGAPAIATGSLVFDPASQQAIPVTLQRVLTGLTLPTSIAHAGDARLFITSQEGFISIVENGALRAEPFLDIRGLVSRGGERGLLGLAFHPRYAQNGRFFVYYTDRNGSVAIARYQVSGDRNRADAASGRVLLTIPKPFGNHNGGQLQFGPDGYLYAGTGDGGGAGDPSCLAQKEDSLLGKLLRLDVDVNVESPPFYGIPPTNPIPGREIWAKGLRNPWRFSFDRRTGDLWIGDVGQGEVEEIDFQPAGATGGRNYGWKPMEGSSCFSNDACPVGTPPCNSPALTPPVFEYTHGQGECSVTGGYVSRGPALPHAYGAYFFGDLCTGRLWAAVRQRNDVRLLPSRAPSVTTFGEDRAGNLWLATGDGDLFRLVPQNPVDTVGLYDPATSRFLFKDLHLDGAADRILRFGPPRNGWQPLAGDWNDDGRTTPGFWDPAARTFRLKNTSQRGSADILFVVTPPSPNAIAIAGDWNGDGRDSVGFYDPGASTFHLTNRLSGARRLEIVFAYGNGGLPVA